MNHLLRTLRLPLLASALLAPLAVQASPSVAIDSAVYVERQEAGGTRRLEPARRLTPGDRVVTVVSWFKVGGDGSFVLTSPLPHRLAYQASARRDEEVSVDGGRNWGRLGSLRRQGRIATAEDVTHVRWRIDPERAGRGSGHFAFAGIVR